MARRLWCSLSILLLAALASAPVQASRLLDTGERSDAAREIAALAQSIEAADESLESAAKPLSLTASASGSGGRGFSLVETVCLSPPLCLELPELAVEIAGEVLPLELPEVGKLHAERGFRLFAVAVRSGDSARHRYYDPQLGRFISADPLGYVDGPSMYSFGLNNPVDFSDPMGLCVGRWKDACWDRVMYFLEGDPEAQVADQVRRNELRIAYVREHGVPTASTVIHYGEDRWLLGNGQWVDPSGRVEADHVELAFVGGGLAARGAFAATRAVGGSMLRASGSAAVAVADEAAGNVVGVNPSVVHAARRFYVDPSGTAIPGSTSQNWQGARVVVPEGHVLSVRDLNLATRPQVIAGPFTDAQRKAFLQGSGSGSGIGPHHRHQIPVTWGGVIDEIPGPGHPLGNQHTAGSPTRHPNRPAPFSRLPGGATLRKQEIRDHFKAKGARLVEIAPGVWIDNGY